MRPKGRRSHIAGVSKVVVGPSLSPFVALPRLCMSMFPYTFTVKNAPDRRKKRQGGAIE